MGLFNSGKDRASVALIDIDSSSIGAALMRIEKNVPPTAYYTVRQFIEPTEHEDAAEAMLRTLKEIAGVLITKGGPVLRQTTGSGHIDRVFVSVGSPWQKTKIRIESVTNAKPFVFTPAVLSGITKKSSEIPEGYLKSEESVIATLLNGYETPKPFGKKVTRADMIVLSSFLDTDVAHEIEKILRKTYHTHSLKLTTFASVAYAAFRDIYPHEKDFLILEVSGEATVISFIKRGLLVDIITVSHGVNDLIRGARGEANNVSFASHVEETEKTWLANIQKALQDASTRHALPHTLFLLADTEAREYLRRLLDASSMRSLWLTDDPLRVISVVPSNFAQFVKTRGDAEGDVFLALLALFSKKTL